MSGNIGTSCIIEAKAGHDLDDLVALIQVKFPNIAEKIDHFEVVHGAAPLFGAGDGPSIKIILRYTNVDQAALEKIREILALAGKTPGEIEVVVDGD